MSDPILRVQNLTKHFPVYKGIVFQKAVGLVRAVDGIDLAINLGQTFSLVGESGCGKSTTGLLILKLLHPTSGSIWFGDRDVANLKGPMLRDYRRSVQSLFQDPYSSLNPRLRIKDSIAEPLVVNSTLSRRELQDRLKEAIHSVGLPEKALDLFPHEFSGGQRQRIALARALILRPKLVVLDEPVSALDVSIRAQVMNDMKDLQEKLGVAYLLIAHGLDTVRYMSHWMGVMYLGRIVEMGPSEELFSHPMHPYTQALFSAALPSHPDRKGLKKIVLRGEVPSPVNIPQGCRFHPRCFNKAGDCSEKEMSLVDMGSQHFVACHRAS